MFRFGMFYFLLLLGAEPVALTTGSVAEELPEDHSQDDAWPVRETGPPYCAIYDNRLVKG